MALETRSPEDIHGLCLALNLLGFVSIRGKARSAAAVIFSKNESKDNLGSWGIIEKLVDFNNLM